MCYSVFLEIKVSVLAEEVVCVVGLCTRSSPARAGAGERKR